MQTIDIILLILLVLGAVRGYLQGFILQIASIAALLLGIWGAIQFSDFTAALLAEKFHITGNFLALISFALTFAAIVVGVHFLGKLIEKLVKITLLGFINNMLGLVFGVIKYALIISVVLVFVDKIDIRFNLFPPQYKENSAIYKPLSRLAPAIYPYLNFEKIKHTFEKPEER